MRYFDSISDIYFNDNFKDVYGDLVLSMRGGRRTERNLKYLKSIKSYPDKAIHNMLLGVAYACRCYVISIAASETKSVNYMKNFKAGTTLKDKKIFFIDEDKEFNMKEDDYKKELIYLSQQSRNHIEFACGLAKNSNSILDREIKTECAWALLLLWLLPRRVAQENWYPKETADRILKLLLWVVEGDREDLSAIKRYGEACLLASKDYYLTGIGQGLPVDKEKRDLGISRLADLASGKTKYYTIYWKLSREYSVSGLENANEIDNAIRYLEKAKIKQPGNGLIDYELASLKASKKNADVNDVVASIKDGNRCLILNSFEYKYENPYLMAKYPIFENRGSLIMTLMYFRIQALLMQGVDSKDKKILPAISAYIDMTARFLNWDVKNEESDFEKNMSVMASRMRGELKPTSLRLIAAFEKDYEAEVIINKIKSLM